MFKFKFLRLIAIIFVAGMYSSPQVSACTGISLTSKDGSKIISRTMEWGTFPLGSKLVLIPRGHTDQAITPSGKDGIQLKARYGYTGIGVLDENFIAEGINEKGMVGELFYFPGYGECEEYDPALKSSSITDAQFLAWVLGSFATVDEMLSEINNIHLIGYGQGFESTHYNVADATGHHVVIEFHHGKFHIHENNIGVITNAPTFDWHMTNLNNFVNVFAGMAKPRQIAPNVNLKSFGMGSASYGLPGDLTPPSRFIRAAFYVQTARQQATGRETVMQTFQILNNFDIPIGSEYGIDETDKISNELLSATQWTTACDTKALKFYYRTEWNSTIRCIDLKKIDFEKSEYQVLPMDKVKEQPVEEVHFN